jgi:MFS family permease
MSTKGAIMNFLPAVLPTERMRVGVLAFLLFVNSFVLESNEVVATSGFVSNVGVSQILLVWAAVMFLALVGSSTYSLFTDRVERRRLGIILFCSFSLIYIGFYVMFLLHAPDFIAYSLLAILNEQQWTLFPLLIWSLANDMFSIPESKRLFPLLAAMVVIGSICGNAIAAAIGQTLGGKSYGLLLFNAFLMLVCAAALLVARARIRGRKPKTAATRGFLNNLREGLSFVRDVPAYRFLSIAMILVGFCLNTIEYQFLVDVSTSYSDPGHLQTFYGIFKVMSVPALLFLQGFAVSWFIKRVGMKYTFAFMPGITLLAVLLTIFWISPVGGVVILTGAIVGDYLMRVTLSGIDEPSRKIFEGYVPEQRRGRVSALMDGVLYPLGSVISCALVGLVVFAVSQTWIDASSGRMLYIGMALVAALAALWAIRSFFMCYEKSMLNWRLSRRKKSTNVLDKLDF